MTRTLTSDLPSEFFTRCTNVTQSATIDLMFPNSIKLKLTDQECTPYGTHWPWFLPTIWWRKRPTSTTSMPSPMTNGESTRQRQILLLYKEENTDVLQAFEDCKK